MRLQFQWGREELHMSRLLTLVLAMVDDVLSA